MKITLVDAQTHEPYANRAVQIQIKNAGTGQILSTFALRTSPEGVITIDQKFENQQLSASINGIRSSWIRAEDGAVLDVLVSASTFAPQNTQNQFTQEKNEELDLGIKTGESGYAEKQAASDEVVLEEADVLRKTTDDLVLEHAGMHEKEGATKTESFTIKNKSTEKT